MSLLIVPAALVLIFFPYEVLHLWTGTEDAARNASTLLSLIALGNLLYALAGFPNLLLFAAGLPMVSAVVLAVLAACILPALFLFVPRFGPIAAAIVWTSACAIYLLAIVPATHRRLLRGELPRWCLWNVLIPATIGAVVFFVARWLMPTATATSVQFLFIACAWATATLCIAVVLPAVRQRLAVKSIRFN